MYIWGSSQVMPADQRGLSYITADGEIDIDESLVYSLLRKELSRQRCHPIVQLVSRPNPLFQGFWDGNSGMLIGAFPGMMLTAKTKVRCKGLPGKIGA